jgi:hypothetical protein
VFVGRRENCLHMRPSVSSNNYLYHVYILFAISCTVPILGRDCRSASLRLRHSLPLCGTSGRSSTKLSELLPLCPAFSAYYTSSSHIRPLDSSSKELMRGSPIVVGYISTIQHRPRTWLLELALRKLNLCSSTKLELLPSNTDRISVWLHN